MAMVTEMAELMESAGRLRLQIAALADKYGVKIAGTADQD
jgi:hypothetical protein